MGPIADSRFRQESCERSGGFLGSLFNDQGQVIGINFAMVRDFGGSNFAIPINYGKALLRP